MEEARTASPSRPNHSMRIQFSTCERCMSVGFNGVHSQERVYRSSPFQTPLSIAPALRVPEGGSTAYMNTAYSQAPVSCSPVRVICHGQAPFFLSFPLLSPSFFPPSFPVHQGFPKWASWHLRMLWCIPRGAARCTWWPLPPVIPGFIILNLTKSCEDTILTWS